MPQWYAVKTHPRRELQVSAVLAHRGIDTYLPMIPKWRRPGQREAPLEPLFPGYLFSRLEMGSHGWIAARSAPGVSYFLGTRDAPVPLPEDLIEAIRERAEARGRERRQPVYAPGDRVVIHGGPFDGLEAVFDGSLSGAGRVRVLLALVSRLTPVELHVDYLRPAG